MRQDEETLRLIKQKLLQCLPASVQLFNAVGLALSGDGINRTFITSDLRQERFAIISLDMAESPKVLISMYCTAEAEGLLKEILQENVDWKKKIELAVSYDIRPTLTPTQSYISGFE